MISLLKKKYIALTFLALFASTSYANTTTNYDGAEERSEHYMRNYVTGVGEGYRWVNQFLIMKGLDPLFCTPDDITFQTDDFMNMIQQEMNNLTEEDAPKYVELMLYIGLVRAFPCEDSSPRSKGKDW